MEKNFKQTDVCVCLCVIFFSNLSQLCFKIFFYCCFRPVYKSSRYVKLGDRFPVKLTITEEEKDSSSSHRKNKQKSTEDTNNSEHIDILDNKRSMDPNHAESDLDLKNSQHQVLINQQRIIMDHCYFFIKNLQTKLLILLSLLPLSMKFTRRRENVNKCTEDMLCLKKYAGENLLHNKVNRI